MTSQTRLSLSVVTELKWAQTFNDFDDGVNSLDFHQSGDVLVAAGNDSRISLIDAVEGKERDHVISSRFGAAHVCMTKKENCVVFASNPAGTSTDHAIRHFSFYDKSFLRYFAGHSDLVTSLSVHPSSDVFLSGSRDGSVRLWDLRMAGCQGRMSLPASTVACYDAQGLVMAVVCQDTVRLYDSKSCDRGPFATFPANVGGSPVSCQFSPSGALLCILTATGKCVIYDTFTYAIIYQTGGGETADDFVLSSTFSPDNRFLFLGTQAGSIAIVEIAQRSSDNVVLQKASTRLQGHKSGITALAFSPTTVLLASADEECLALSTHASSERGSARDR